MSRYTEKPHGLTIGWDNNFFYFVPNPDEGMALTRDFPCIVSLQRYYYDQSVAYSVNKGQGILTPAEQLLLAFRQPKEHETVSGECDADFDFSNVENEELRQKLYEGRMANRRPIAIPSELARKWLDANAPGWGCPENYDRTNFSFFFAKKKHANAFCEWIEEILAGMYFG